MSLLKQIFKKSHFLVLILYLLTFLIFTYPLVFHPKDSLPGFPLDGFNYMWNVYVFWHEISQFHNPFFTNQIFYPIGANLVMHTYGPLISLFGLPFLKNLALYINFLILAGMIGSSFNMYLLARILSKNTLVAFLSGLIYGFSPIMFSFVISQHYYYIFAAPLLPLAILCLLKLFEEVKLRYLLALSILFWASFFVDQYSTILLIIIISTICLFLLVNHFKRIRNFNMVHLITILGVNILVALLVLVRILNIGALKTWATSKSYYPTYCSANPKGFLIPSQTNPLLKNISNSLYEKLGVKKNLDTPSYFLGWGILIIALTSILKIRKEKYTIPLFVLGTLILLLSLGPRTPIFRIFSTLPFMGLVDCPQRFVIGTQLCLAALLAIGNKKKLAVSAILFFFLVEYGQWGVPVFLIETPTIYKQLAADPKDRTVLELPSGISESKGAFGYDWSIQGLHLKQLYWQTFHKKPRVGGYLSRLPESTYGFFENEPVISDLFTMTSLNGKWSNRVFSDEEVSLFIKKFNLGFIILSPNSRIGEFQKITGGVFKNFIANKTEQEGFILYTLKTP